jgi:hypothetical protein
VKQLLSTIVRRFVALLLLPLLLTTQPGPSQAGPVDWHEVPSTSEGRQWWDGGSLRITRNGMLTVLSRFQPAESDQGELYVMEIDCGQRLYRDTAVNGLPRWGAAWQPVSGDGLIASVIDDSCLAANLQSLP